MGDINAHVREMRRLEVAEKQIEAGVCSAMSDQEIRARALECAVRLIASFPRDVQEGGTVTNILDYAHGFEAYIRDGVT